MFAFKGTSKTCLPCSYMLLEAATAGHCQRQADGLEQPMAWPGPLQQCSLLFWVTIYGRGTAAHRLLAFCFSAVCVKSKGRTQGTAQLPAEGSCVITAGLFIPPHHCWIIYPTLPSTAAQEEGRKRIMAREICQERGKRASLTQPCVLLLFGARRKEGT